MCRNGTAMPDQGFESFMHAQAELSAHLVLLVISETSPDTLTSPPGSNAPGSFRASCACVLLKENIFGFSFKSKYIQSCIREICKYAIRCLLMGSLIVFQSYCWA